MSETSPIGIEVSVSDGAPGERHTAYRWSEVVVATVVGRVVRLFDGADEPSIQRYPTPAAAHQAARAHAQSFEDARQALAEDK